MPAESLPPDEKVSVPPLNSIVPKISPPTPYCRPSLPSTVPRLLSPVLSLTRTVPSVPIPTMPLSFPLPENSPVEVSYLPLPSAPPFTPPNPSSAPSPSRRSPRMSQASVPDFFSPVAPSTNSTLPSPSIPFASRSSFISALALPFDPSTDPEPSSLRSPEPVPLMPPLACTSPTRVSFFSSEPAPSSISISLRPSGFLSPSGSSSGSWSPNSTSATLPPPSPFASSKLP